MKKMRYTAYPHVSDQLPKDVSTLHLRDVPQFPRSAYEIDVSWGYLHRQLENEEELGLDLDPEFQRDHVWTPEQQTAYVEYRLMGGEIGSNITLVTDSWMHGRSTFYALLDGKQRIHAVQRYLNDEIHAFRHLRSEFLRKGDLPLFGASGTGFRWRVIEVPTYADALGLYLQINAGGTPHTRAEIDKVIAMRAAELAKPAPRKMKTSKTK